MATTAGKMTVDEVCRLMEVMADKRVASLEYEGLKLILAPPERALASAASGIGTFAQTQPPGPPVNAEDAMKAVQKARVQARVNAEAKLAAEQSKTARLRAKAAGGIGSGVGKAVESVYKDSLKRPPPVEPQQLPLFPAPEVP